MLLFIKIILIYLLYNKHIFINCEVLKNNKTIDSNNDYDYDNQTNDKIFDLIEEQELIDLIKETEASYISLNLKNLTKDEKELNKKAKEYLDNKNTENSEEYFKELELNVTKLQEAERLKAQSDNKYVNPIAREAIDRFELMSRPLIRKLMPIGLPLTDMIYEGDLSPLCLAALIRLSKGIKEKSLWAFKWVDSMGRIPSGIFDGTTFDFGEYDQCLNSAMPTTPSSDLVIKAKYCIGGISSKDLIDKFSYAGGIDKDTQAGVKNKLFGHKNVRLISREAYINAISKASKDSGIKDNLLDFSTVADFTYRGKGIPIGICIPETCSALEINEFFNKTIYPKTGLPFGIAGGCHSIDDPIVLDTHQIIAISTFAILFVLVIVSSIVDSITKKDNYLKIRNSFATKLLFSFSYKKNVEVLGSPPKKIRCIDGIRVMASVWIFIAHSYLFNIILSFSWKRPKATFLPVFETDERYLLVRNAYLTETFFFMSSFLFTYIMFPKIERMKGRFNYFLLLFIRWLRFIPTLVASIFLLYLAPLFGSGPIFKSAYQTMNYPCYKNWYKNILFVNNILLETIDEMCNGPSWYLSAEFQLFIFAPLLLILLYRKPKFATILLAFLTVFGCLTSILPALILDKRPTTNLINFEDPEQLYIDLYYYLYPPYTHLSAYMLGILVGYLMLKHSDYCRNLNRLTVWLIWIVSIGLGIFAFTFNKDWSKPGKAPKYEEVLLLIAVKSLCISGFTCGLTFNCANGYGGYLNKFLSWKVWVPLARLSMGVYLYQMPVIFHRVYSTKYSIEMTDHYILTTVAFDCILTFIISFILYMLVEGPFGNITTLLTTPQTRPQKSLGENFNKNISINKNNVQISTFKTVSESIDNNNNLSKGTINPLFITEESVKL